MNKYSCLPLALLAALTIIGDGQARALDDEITAVELGYAIGNDEEAAAAVFLGKTLKISNIGDGRGLCHVRQTAGHAYQGHR